MCHVGEPLGNLLAPGLTVLRASFRSLTPGQGLPIIRAAWLCSLQPWLFSP